MSSDKACNVWATSKGVLELVAHGIEPYAPFLDGTLTREEWEAGKPIAGVTIDGESGWKVRDILDETGEPYCVYDEPGENGGMAWIRDVPDEETGDGEQHECHTCDGEHCLLDSQIADVEARLEALLQFHRTGKARDRVCRLINEAVAQWDWDKAFPLAPKAEVPSNA